MLVKISNIFVETDFIYEISDISHICGDEFDEPDDDDYCTKGFAIHYLNRKSSIITLDRSKYSSQELYIKDLYDTRNRLVDFINKNDKKPIIEI